MSDQYLYPFDPTGKAATNKVVGEQQILSPPSWTDFYFIIPKMAPFFREGLKLVHQPSGKELVEGIDYHLTHQFKDATLGTAKSVYGSITFLDKSLTGALSLTYQTLGGRWILDEQKLIEILSNTKLNPRITTWEQVIGGMPVKFPPIDHHWHVDDLIGMKEVVEATVAIAEALGSEGGAGDSHLSDRDNPHRVTKAQVGLGSVEDYPVADRVEAEQGVANDRYMTPERTKQAIAAQATGAVNEHAEREDNPHNVNKDQVGLSDVPNWGGATPEDAVAGEAANKIMSPATTRQAVDTWVGNTLREHIEDRANPHGITAEVLGALTAEQVAELLLGKLGVNDKATDSARLDGMELSGILDYVAGTVGERLAGQYLIPSPTDGVSYTLIGGVGIYDPLAPTIEPDLTPYPYEPDTDDDGNIIRYPDLVFLLTGIGSDHLQPTTVHLVRVSREPKGDVEVFNLTGAQTTSQLGVTLTTAGAYHLWLKGEDKRSRTTITILSPTVDFDFYLESQADEPAGIVYYGETMQWNEKSLPKATEQQAREGENDSAYMTPLMTREAVLSVLYEAGIYYDETLGKWVLDGNGTTGGSGTSGVENPNIPVMDDNYVETPYDDSIDLRVRFTGDVNVSPSDNLFTIDDRYPVPWNNGDGTWGTNLEYGNNLYQEALGEFPESLTFPGIKNSAHSAEFVVAADSPVAMEVEYVKADGKGGVEWVIPYEVEISGLDTYANYKSVLLAFVDKNADPLTLSNAQVHAGVRVFMKDGVHHYAYLSDGVVQKTGLVEGPTQYSMAMENYNYDTATEVATLDMRFSASYDYLETVAVPYLRNVKLVYVVETNTETFLSFWGSFFTDPAFTY